jgi:ABC-type Mn2+/Zn2+ transport system permease subunit
MIDELLQPYHFEFFRNGVAVATIAGGLCGLVGVFVVQRSMSYIGHGLSHAIFGGFAASALLGVNYFIGAGIWGVASALMINGVTLVAASVVIPAVVARMLTDSFGQMLILATAIGAACACVGMNVSYQVDVQSGPTIVLTGAALFALVLAYTSARAAQRQRRPVA